MTVKKFCKYGKYGSFEHLLFLFQSVLHVYITSWLLRCKFECFLLYGKEGFFCLKQSIIIYTACLHHSNIIVKSVCSCQSII